MKKLLNTLYITSAASYLALDGENVVVRDGDSEIGRLPLHNLDGIVSFGYRGMSPALMGACAEKNIAVSFLTPQGRFLARVTGKVQGNVLLRKIQYLESDSPEKSCSIARNCILGKVYNSRWVLERALRDHSMQIDVEKIRRASMFLQDSLKLIRDCQDSVRLRGVEGEAASLYFGVFTS